MGFDGAEVVGVKVGLNEGLYVNTNNGADTGFELVGALVTVYEGDNVNELLPKYTNPVVVPATINPALLVIDTV